MERSNEAALTPDPIDLNGSRLSQRVGDILPILVSSARDTEVARRMLPETMALLREIGWWRALAPSAYGGLQADLYDWLQCVRMMSAADLSTGWVAGLLGCHTIGIALLHKQAQDEVWGENPDALIVSAGVAAPGFKREVRKVDGGFVISSRHRFSSGSSYADWATTQFMHTDETGRTQGYRGIVPRKDFEVVDTWYVSGMQGTGSGDVIFEDVFIPEHRYLRMAFGDEERAPDIHPHPMYRMSFMAGYNLPFGAFMLGALEGALQLAEDAMKNRVRASLFGKTRAEHVPSQLRLAESKLDALAAALVADRRWTSYCRVAAEGRMDTLEELKEWRVLDAYVSQLAVRVVNRLMAQAGPSANLADYPLQRFWRDINVASQHPVVEVDGAYQVYARQVLGLPRDPTLLFS